MPTRPRAFIPPTHDAGTRDDHSAQQTYSSHRWTQFSRRFRRLYPFCLDPFQTHRHLTPTDHAHHIHKLRRTLEHAYNPDEIIPVCRACHDRIEPMAEGDMPGRVTRWREDEEWRDNYWEADL